MLSTTFPFTALSNYTFDSDEIEVISGKARLKLVDLLTQLFNQPFTADTGFTYDSVLSEFVAGKLQQKDQLLANAACGATFNSNINLEGWSEGVAAGTPIGGASISGGKLDLAHDDIRYVDYDADLNADNQQTGCVRFKVIPNYTGSPSSVYYFFDIGSTSLKNRITFYQIPDKTVYLTIYNNTNGRILIIGGGVWDVIVGQEYEVEIDFDITNGETRIFIDGVQYGVTATQTGIRDADITGLRIGSRRDSNDTSNYFIKDFIVFNSVQHTTDYTPGYSVPKYKYLEDLITLPQFAYLGVGSIQAFTAFVATITGAIKMNMNGLYWNGSAWAASDDSYAQMNDSITINTNIDTLPASDVLDIKLRTVNGGIQQDIDDLTATYTGQIFSTSNPTIKSNSAIDMDALVEFMVTITESGSDLIKFTIQVDNVEKYWDGVNWVMSSGYAQSNTATEINDHVSSLDISLGVKLIPVVYLHSDDGSSTPNIDEMAISYDFFNPSPDLPSICVVNGYLLNADNTPIQNATIKASLKLNDFIDSKNFRVLRQKVSTTSNVNGYFELELIQSLEYINDVNYDILIQTADNEIIDVRKNLVIPNLSFCNYSDL